MAQARPPRRWRQPLIINVRGASGSGKTELARRVIGLYGLHGRTPKPLYRPGRLRPICYELDHPHGGPPLALLGHYEVTSGGCDTLGPTSEAARLVAEQASRGADVLFEGLDLSRDHDLTRTLAERRRLHVLRLTTPLEQCIRNVIRRRRAAKRSWSRIAATLARDHAEIEQACTELEGVAQVEYVDFDEAFARIAELLDLPASRGGASDGDEQQLRELAKSGIALRAQRVTCC